MNEQVIEDLFNQAVSKGYKKSREEFVNLLHTNDAVLNDMYSYVQSKGYQKGIEDFSGLVGKKKDVTGLSTVDGTLDLPSGEKDTALERTFGKNAVTNFFGDIYRAYEGGAAKVDVVDPTMNIFGKKASEIDEDALKEFVEYTNKLKNVPVTDELKEYYKSVEDAGGGFMNSIIEAIKNPAIIPQLTVDSFSMLIPVTSEGVSTYGLGGAAAGTTAGAGTGAAFGALGGPLAPISATAGAVAGGLRGLMAGMSATTEVALSYGQYLQEEAEKRGLEFNEQNVKKLLEDQTVIDGATNRAIARGATIGLVDAITSGLAGRALGATKAAVKGTAGKVIGTGAALGVESVGEGVGEGAAQGVSGQEVSGEEIALEMLGGIGGGVFNVGVETIIGGEKVGRYRINGEEVSKNRLNRFLNTATPEEVAKTNIEVTDDNDVLAVAEDKKKEAMLAGQIDPAVTEETDKSRLVKLERERAKLKGNDTKSAQNRVKAIDEEIDSITGKYTLDVEGPKGAQYKIDGSNMDRARFVAAVEEAKNEEALNELETTDPEVQKVIDAKRAQLTGEVQPTAVETTETAVEAIPETQPVTINVADKYTVDEVERVKTLPIENEDGATMNLDGTKYEKGGVVIPLASRNMAVSELTPEKIDEFVKENSESIGSDMVKVGIYKFPNSDQASIDINIVADRSRRDEAIEIARELGQESIFDLDTFENIKTGADGKNPKVLTPKEFLAIQDRLSKPKQTEVTVTPETSSNYANMTEDNEGNFVFFHVGKKGYDTIKKGTGASQVTSREEASALSKVGGLAMYYTAPEQTERQSADGAKYAVKVPKEKVYDFNTDKLNLIDEARQRHEAENPGKAFDTNSQIAYVTKIAGERGFDMVVADWAGGTRAQTTKELTPVDVQESTGNVIEKNFDNQYESNKTKGFTPVVPKRKADKLQALYDKINEVRNAEQRYDNLYRLYTDSSKYTQEEITDLIEKSDLPQDIKNEYNEILASKEETRRSEQKKAEPTNVEESIKNSAKTLQTSFPGVNIIVSENTEDAKKQIIDQLTPIVGEENAKTIADQIETARGQAVFYKGKPVAVVVNKEKAVSNTAAHEVWHLILREAFGKNAKKFKSFQNAISRELKSAGYTDVADYLDRFSAEYEGDAAYEEYLAELGGLLTTKGFDPKNLTAQEKSILNKIKEIINKFAKSIVGQDVFLKDAKPENILQFMINVSDLVAKGEDVRPAIGKTEAKQLKAGVDVVKQIDVNKVRASNRPGNKISKGLSVSGSGKNKSASETDDLSIEYVKNNSPKIFISNAKIIAEYPLVSNKIGDNPINTVKDAQKVYDIFTEEVSENLIYLMDEFNKEFKDVSSLWYDGANIIANRLASKYGVTPEQAAGIIASLSPQKDWYQNVRLAELVLMAYQDNPVITKEMIDYQVSINKKGLYEGQNAPGKGVKKAEAEYKISRTNSNREALINAKEKLTKAEKKADDLIKMLNKYVGVKINDAPIFVQPYAVRTYHEINTTKNYDVLTPDGNSVGLAKGTKGENKKLAWGSYSEIGKAVSIYNDNSSENITKSLGEMHKIRNFYNNIIDPMSKDGDVTIDTHAVAAALLKPLSGTSKEVKQNFGEGTSNSSTLGIKGVYYAYSDAYALAAKKTGLLPRQVQSITWEAVRGLYKDKFKSKKENVSEINKIWERYEKGQITISEARELAKEKAGGIEDPTWAGGLIQDESREGYGVEGYGSGVIGDGPDIVGDLEVSQQKQLPARVNEQVNNIISEQKALGKKPVEIAREAAKYVKTTDAYKKLGDRDKAKVIGGIKRLSGMRVRVLVDEYANLKDQLRAAEKLSDANKKLPNYKQTLSDLVNSVRALAKAGKISTFRAGVIIGRIVKTNLTSPESVNKTINYIADIFDNANLAMKISRAKSLVKNAKRNINSKIGQNPDLFNAGKILVSIDPVFIPTPMIDDYLDIMEVIGERARVLSIKDSGELTAKMNVIINAVMNESEDVVNSAEQEKIRMTPEESVVAAQSLIDQIKADKLETSNIIDVNDAAVARKIASITEKDMMDLLSIDKDGITDFSKLKLLLSIRDNIKAGIVTHEAMLMATAVAQNRSVNTLTEVVGKITGPKILNGVTRTISKIKGKITGRGGVLEAIRSTPLEFMDDVIGNFNDKTIFNLTFGVLGSKKGMLDARLADLAAKADAAEKLLQSAGRTDNAVVEVKYKIMALQLQREFESNPGSPSVAPAIEFIDATLRAIRRKESSLTNNDARILEEVRSQITANGIASLENSLTVNDKKAMALIDEINAAQASEALFTSAVVRGTRVNIINNYVHHAVLSKNMAQQIEALINKLFGKGPNGKPSTKAGTLNERTPGAKPIMFDPVSASMRGARETLTDFYMTPAIREVTGMLSKLKDKVFDDPNSTEQQRDVAQALVEAVEEALEVTFQNHFGSDTNAEAFVKAMQKLGYQTTLASIPRAFAELSSNMAFAILSDPKTTAEALKHTNFAFSSDLLGFLEKIGSAESTRLAGNQMLTGKYAEGGFASGYGRTSKSAASSKVMDYASFITRMTVGKVYRTADVVSDLLISTPDKVVSKAYYVANFINNFQEITGIKLTEADLRKISDGTSQYLSPEFESAIEKSRQKADSDIVRMAASGNSFNTILKNVPRKKDNAMMSGYRAINSFMSRFYLTEYGTLRSAVIALFKSGQIDKKMATAIIAASVTRMSMYLVAYSLLSSIFDSIIGEAFDLEGEDEDDEDLMMKVKRSIVGTGVGVLSRRTLGNLGYIPVAYGVEQLNAELGEDFGLRDDEYDPFKNSLVYSKISETDLNTKSPWEVFGKAIAGPYGPTLSTFTRALTLYGRATKEGSKPETKKRAMKELETRMAFEAAGNAGLIPFYKDARRILMSDFYARNYDKKESSSFTITQKQIDLIRKSNPTAARQLQQIYDMQKAQEKKVRDLKKRLEKK